MRHAFFAQPGRSRFQHDAHGRADWSQQGNFLRCHASGVDVGQQAGLCQYSRCDFVRVFQRGGHAHFVEGIAGGTVAQLRLFAEREQGFLAPTGCALPTQVQYRVHGHVSLSDVPGSLGEGAIVTDITAQVREWNEDLA